jgi:hypothetical protein
VILLSCLFMDKLCSGNAMLKGLAQRESNSEREGPTISHSR